ncbi:MAG: LysM peptidoglycan-binding domain-containing M23 family metallopeptidase [Spirochaetota bacterium]
MAYAREVVPAADRRRRMAPRRLVASVILVTALASLSAEYPVVRRLDRSDALFVQHQSDVEAYYRGASSGGDLPPLLLYRYEVQEHDTLFGLAARFSLPYSAIATLNGFSSPVVPPGTEILVPGVPGIFVPIDPATDLASILHDLRRDRSASVVTVVRDGTREAFRFFPGEDFLPEERRAFLGLLFRHPLPGGELSSPWGPRRNPITTQWSFHGGVDYAAASGTRVLAARGGVVSDVGFNEILGNYIVVSHTGGFETVYGHLQSVAVSLNDEVRSGMMLGAVGSTGMVTGPHLHFEIRQRGRSRDPESMLP